MKQGIAMVVLLCVCCLLLGILVYRYRYEKKLLERLDQMLREAVSGEFKEGNYDETLLSEVEFRMARFLSKSDHLAQNLEKERSKIKALISDISHQIKTPISNLLLYSELLLEMQLPKEGICAAEMITKYTEKMKFLIDALIKMSRLESGVIAVNPVISSVWELLEAACQEVSPAAFQKGITIQREDTDIQAVFDVKWTKEALFNLMENAVKYTPFEGRVSIAAIEFELFCRIDIKDTGIGIAEEEQGKIFTRFYRSQQVAAEEGVGVGLYLAREIISLQGGYIKVDSAPGKGSLFSVYLPLK